MSVQNLAQYSDLEQNTVDKGITVGGKTIGNGEQEGYTTVNRTESTKLKSTEVQSTKSLVTCSAETAILSLI